MTKKEKAELEAAKTLAALRWTAEVKPDIPIPEFQQTTHGYTFHAWSGNWRVEKAWSQTNRHGTGDPNRVGSQHGRALYSTELLATKAARHALEREFAERLRSIDLRIESLEAE